MNAEYTPIPAQPAPPEFRPGPPALQALAELSAQLGADPELIQAAGGNTSLKLDDTLWVKASGLWLRDALQRPLFTPVRLSDVRRAVAAGEADPVSAALCTELAPPGLRPSIETTLHALMPHPVVLHVHAVDAIAWAVLPDARESLRGPLADVRWAWVDYARPGLPLTRAVAAQTRRADVDVLLLANHGLVVGGADVAEARTRLRAVCAALHRPPRQTPLPDAADLLALGALAAAAPAWRLPAEPRSHRLARDPVHLRRAAAGVLYPDHVVFLGDRLCIAPTPRSADDAALPAFLATLPDGPARPPCVAVPGRGLLVRQDLDAAAEAMLACWADVLERLPQGPDAPEPVYLAADEARDLAQWEAEKFRRLQVR